MMGTSVMEIADPPVRGRYYVSYSTEDFKMLPFF